MKDVLDLPRYYIDFYDAFDGWTGELTGICGIFASDDLEKMKEQCNLLQEKLGNNNKKCGEYYCVMDRILGMTTMKAPIVYKVLK